MDLKELEAEIANLLNDMDTPPEDAREIYARLHQKLNELRATGQPLPRDLLDLEEALMAAFCEESQGR
ncbi:MAG: hypothetical protein GC150_04295 [Rhizobiales bacterium]|nr:hypothetical protein [Hyphomicrobiales bacterium]